MKKIIALVLALVMCLTLFAACGKKTETKVAVQKGTTSFMYAELLKGVQTVSYDTFALAVNDMKNGNAAYVMVDKTTAKSLCKEIEGIKMIDIALSSENYGIAIDPNQADLKTKIDDILTAKAAEIDAIKDKYMNGEETKYVGVTSATKDTAKAATQLVVATNAEFAPWEYKEGDKYYGIDMEIAQLLATELGLELVIDNMEFDMVVGAVGKQGVDIAMSGITITAERLGVVNFSTPYYTEALVVVCKADDTSLDAVGTVVDLLTVICNNTEEEK